MDQVVALEVKLDFLVGKNSIFNFMNGTVELKIHPVKETNLQTETNTGINRLVLRSRVGSVKPEKNQV